MLEIGWIAACMFIFPRRKQLTLQNSFGSDWKQMAVEMICYPEASGWLWIPGGLLPCLSALGLNKYKLDWEAKGAFQEFSITGPSYWENGNAALFFLLLGSLVTLVCVGARQSWHYLPQILKNSHFYSTPGGKRCAEFPGRSLIERGPLSVVWGVEPPADSLAELICPPVTPGVCDGNSGLHQ